MLDAIASGVSGGKSDRRKTTLFADHVAELGEGPGYDPLSGNVWWFDILGQKLIEKNWDSGEIHVHALGMKASALAVIDRDRQLIVSEHGLFIRERANGRLTLHHPLEAENDVTRSNDARVHPSGSFWIGTMGKSRDRCRLDLVVSRRPGEKLFSGITITNSICFSSDGKIAYFADTDRNIIWRVDTDPETGLPISDKASSTTGPKKAASMARSLMRKARCGMPVGAAVRSMPIHRKAA